MAINLTKGQKIDLTKGNPSLNKLMVGLGWDPIEQKKSGGFFSQGPAPIDCDASILMLEQGKKITSKEDLVYFGNLTSMDGAVVHQGDNLTGEGDGDDEKINITLSSIAPRIHKLVFVVNIYDAVKRKQHFGMIQNAFIRIVNEANGEELIRYNISEAFPDSLSLVVGEMYRHNGEWKFAAIGSGTQHPGIGEFAQDYC